MTTEVPEQVDIECDEDGVPSKAAVDALGGKSYIAARMRDWATDRHDYGKTPGGKPKKFARLPVVAVHNCLHTYTVCATRECVESWSCDWNLYLQRTEGGRLLSQKLELTTVEEIALCDDEQRSVHLRSIEVRNLNIYL